MNAELAQVITLVAWGNAYLNGAPADVRSHAAFPSSASVHFIRPARSRLQRDRQIARNAEEWFFHLHRTHVRRLWMVDVGVRLDDIAPYIAAGFAGGAGVGIRADLPDRSELWSPQWKSAGRGTPGWKVDYIVSDGSPSPTPPTSDLEAARTQLIRAISQARAFALALGDGPSSWASLFGDCLDLLDDSGRHAAQPTDLLPPTGYRPETRRLVAAAAKAHVFSGEGWWNDLSFEDAVFREKYEEVTRTLFAAVQLALLLGVNEYDPTLWS